SLPVQGGIWAAGFGVWLVLLALCARQTWRQDVGAAGDAGSGDPRTAKDAVSPWTKARWGVLAFVPSSLMLGCTSHLTAEVASVPLMWVVPLALYLLSFVIAFARSTPAWVHRAMVFGLPVALVLQLACEGRLGLGVSIATHLTTLFIAAMVCHGEL